MGVKLVAPLVLQSERAKQGPNWFIRDLQNGGQRQGRSPLYSLGVRIPAARRATTKPCDQPHDQPFLAILYLGG